MNALPKPPYVDGQNEYLFGSRGDVIKVTADWLEEPNQLTFWMYGGPGLGKSTLAHKIVDSLQDDGHLATFTFLVRGSSSDPATVIQTMAKELCALHPRSIPQVAAAARTCNSSHLPLRDYMESYIIEPIRSLSYPYPLVIVVDGLDEWVHHGVPRGTKTYPTVVTCEDFANQSSQSLNPALPFERTCHKIPTCAGVPSYY